MAKDSAKKKANIFLFHGDDDFSARKTVDAWRDAFVRKYGVHGISVLRADEEGEALPAKLEELIEANSLFSMVRLIIVYDLFVQKADIQQGVIKSLEKMGPQTFIVFAERKSARQALKLYKYFTAAESKGVARIQKFELPTGEHVVQQVGKLAQSYGAKIDRAAASELASRLGFEQTVFQNRASMPEARPDMWKLSSEIQKLATYCGNRAISLADVQLLIAPKLSDDAFGIVDAASQGKTADGIRRLNELFAAKGVTASDIQSQALAMVGVLASQFRGMLQLLDAQEHGLDPSSVLGWNSYRVSAVGRVAHRFKKKQAARYLEELAHIDRQLKRTTVPAKVLLSRFVQSIG